MAVVGGTGGQEGSRNHLTSALATTRFYLASGGRGKREGGVRSLHIVGRVGGGGLPSLYLASLLSAGGLTLHEMEGGGFDKESPKVTNP